MLAWYKLRKPFFALAPMADVTDAAFRRVVAECAKPDVLFTEFVVADGLMHPKGRERLLFDLRYSEIERPIVAQIWGGQPENVEGAARLVKELGFDGVDINMGCPDRGVEKQKGGAYLMRDFDLAKRVIEAAQKGAGPLPVSVKTRLGYNSVDFDWLSMLAGTGIAALTVHLRTRKEMSKASAHWELAPELSRLRGQSAAWRSDRFPLIIANGDVESMEDARGKAVKNNLDGVMLGRAIFGNPWLFSGRPKPDWSEVFKVMIHHTQLFEELYGGIKNFAIMRKFFGAYVSGHPRAHDLKSALMLCTCASEVERVLRDYK